MLKNIPGWMAPRDLQLMTDMAQAVPEGGLIVEVGSWMGQSTQTWALNTKGRVIAIDKWEWMPPTYDGPHGELVNLKGNPFAQFQAFTAHLHNITPMRRNSSGGDWSEPLADIVFIDAMHRNPWIHDDIVYWETKVKPGGFICGDDYSKAFPDVITEAKACAERLMSPLETPGQKFWRVRLPR